MAIPIKYCWRQSGLRMRSYRISNGSIPLRRIKLTTRFVINKKLTYLFQAKYLRLIE